MLPHTYMMYHDDNNNDERKLSVGLLLLLYFSFTFTSYRITLTNITNNIHVWQSVLKIKLCISKIRCLNKYLKSL